MTLQDTFEDEPAEFWDKVRDNRRQKKVQSLLAMYNWQVISREEFVRLVKEL